MNTGDRSGDIVVERFERKSWDEWPTVHRPDNFVGCDKVVCCMKTPAGTLTVWLYVLPWVTDGMVSDAVFYQAKQLLDKKLADTPPEPPEER